MKSSRWIIDSYDGLAFIDYKLIGMIHAHSMQWLHIDITSVCATVEYMPTMK